MVFRFPEDPSQFFIKRIIGLPEETIEISDNRVIIYNEENREGLIINESDYLDPGQRTEGRLKIKLDEKEYFVLGDNRLQSSDSRRWGPLDESFIVGRVLIRAWPIEKTEYFER